MSRLVGEKPDKALEPNWNRENVIADKRNFQQNGNETRDDKTASLRPDSKDF